MSYLNEAYSATWGMLMRDNSAMWRRRDQRDAARLQYITYQKGKIELEAHAIEYYMRGIMEFDCRVSFLTEKMIADLEGGIPVPNGRYVVTGIFHASDNSSLLMMKFVQLCK